MPLTTILEPYKDIMKKFPLFEGIDPKDHEAALECLGARVRKSHKNETLLMIGSDFRYAYYLLEGCLQVSFLNEAYDEITVNQFLPGSFVGESFAIKENEKSPLQIRSVSESVYLTLDLMNLRGGCHDCRNCFPFRHTLVTNLMLSLADQNIFLNQKVRILGQKGVRDRIMVYLSTLPKSANGSVLVPFSRTEMAEFLGLNRSAMSRELGRMADEGLITVRGRRITVHA